MSNPVAGLLHKPFSNYDMAAVKNQVDYFQKLGVSSHYDIKNSNSGLVPIVVENWEQRDGTEIRLLIHKTAKESGFFGKKTHWFIEVIFLDPSVDDPLGIAVVDAKTQIGALDKAIAEVRAYLLGRDMEQQEPVNDYDSDFYVDKQTKGKSKRVKKQGRKSGKNLPPKEYLTETQEINREILESAILQAQKQGKAQDYLYHASTKEESKLMEKGGVIVVGGRPISFTTDLKAAKNLAKSRGGKVFITLKQDVPSKFKYKLENLKKETDSIKSEISFTPPKEGRLEFPVRGIIKMDVPKRRSKKSKRNT